MKTRNIILTLLIIFISGSVFTSCSSTDSELKEALENGDVYSNEGDINPDTAPFAVAGDNQSVELNDEVELDGNGSSDPNQDTLDYLWEFVSTPTGNPPTLVDNNQVVAKFIADAVGLYEISLTVSDGNESHTDSVIINVASTIPVSNAGDAKNVMLNEELTLDGSGSSNALTYLWEFLSWPAGSTYELSDSNTVAPKFTANTLGKYEISLTVSNGTITDTSTVIITVTNDNTAPTANIDVDSTEIKRNEPLTLYGTNSSDPDAGDTLTYSWRLEDKPSGSLVEFDSLLNVNTKTFSADMLGTYQISLTVSDGTESQTDTVIITAINMVPVANITAESTEIQRNDPLTIDGTNSSDSDTGDTLTYSWTLENKPAGSLVEFDSSQNVNTKTLSADIPGTYEISLTVSDGTDSHTDTIIINAVNTSPIANINVNATDVKRNDRITLDGINSSDLDGDSLNYSWALVKPAESTVVFISPTNDSQAFTVDEPGEYVISLTVDDGIDTNTTTITITAENSIPIANAGNSANVPVGSNITLDGAGSSDADSVDTLSYAWKFTLHPEGTVNLSGGTTEAPSFVADAFGAYVIELIVFDGYDYSEPDTVEIIVGSVPDTGQTSCFDAAGIVIPCPTVETAPFYGQDSCYSINSPSYTKLDSNGNDLSDNAINWVMVRDNVTGLVWEVKTTDGSFQDNDRQYSWSSPGNALPESTGYYLNSLNNAGFGGFNDWRLPTDNELIAIADYSVRGFVPVDASYFNNTQSDFYWTSNRYGASACTVKFTTGFVSYSDMSTPNYVRAVRGGQSTFSYTDNGDGTITDNKTGLMWMKAAPSTPMNWEEALIYCEALEIANYFDWRLPNIKELRTLVNSNSLYPTIDTDYFLNDSNNTFWSSTPGINNPGHAWVVSFDWGSMGCPITSEQLYIRAVRGGQ